MSGRNLAVPRSLVVPQGSFVDRDGPRVLLGVQHNHAAWTNQEVVDVGAGAGKSKVVSDDPSTACQLFQGGGRLGLADCSLLPVVGLLEKPLRVTSELARTCGSGAASVPR